MPSQWQGHHDKALSQAQQALDLFRATGHHRGEASALNNIGWCYAQAGDFRESIAFCRKALALQREIGSRRGEAATLDSLGWQAHIGGVLGGVAAGWVFRDRRTAGTADAKALPGIRSAGPR